MGVCGFILIVCEIDLSIKVCLWQVVSYEVRLCSSLEHRIEIRIECVFLNIVEVLINHHA